MIDFFQAEGLPSSLQPLSDAMRDTVDPGQMTAADVAQWAEEQLRDMRRLAKHLGDVRSTVRPLKEALVKAETERDRFCSQLANVKKEFKQEVERHQASEVQLEFSLKKAERFSRETERRLQEEQNQLKRGGKSIIYTLPVEVIYFIFFSFVMLQTQTKMDLIILNSKPTKLCC